MTDPRAQERSSVASSDKKKPADRTNVHVFLDTRLVRQMKEIAAARGQTFGHVLEDAMRVFIASYDWTD